jgi:hypothetical protein
MRRYPIRFWFLASLSLLIAGAVALGVDFLLRKGHEAFDGTFFFWGLGLLAAVNLWLRIVKPVS